MKPPFVPCLKFLLFVVWIPTCKSIPEKNIETSSLSIISGGNRTYSIQSGISICYRQSSSNSDWQDIDQLNATFKEAIESEWGAKAGVKTLGWKPCSELPDAQVQLNFFDCGENLSDCPDRNRSPHVAFIGPPGSGPNVINLRRTYENHYRFDECNGRQKIINWTVQRHSELKGRQRCTRNYGIHEFGHILGFDHEQYHPDGPAQCDDDSFHFAKAGSGAARWLCSVGYDDESVMNYCGKKFLNWDGGLGKKDVQCAKEFFAGRP